MTILIPSHLSDSELGETIARLVSSERGATARLVAHLAEFDARKLHLAEGFSSLFAYCCEVLHLSESEAGNRITAARTARRFPAVLDLLADGSVSLTTVRLLAPYLTDANHRDLLTEATHRNKEAVEELIARWFHVLMSLCPYARSPTGPSRSHRGSSPQRLSRLPFPAAQHPPHRPLGAPR
jgi:hypothetical protein